MSNDCGSSYSLVGFGHKLDRVKFSHVNRDWLLFTRFVKCKPSKRPCKRDSEDLYLWTNSNKTRVIHKEVQDFDWVSNTDNILEEFPMDGFIFTSMMQSEDKNVEKLNLFYCTELGSQKKLIAEDLFSYSLSQNFLYIVKNSGDQNSLQVAELRRTLKFSTVHFTKSVEIRTAAFIEFDSTQSFAFFETKNSNDHHRRVKEFHFQGTLYTTDGTGHHLSFSLDSVVLGADGDADLMKVKSLMGIFICNRYKSQEEKMLKVNGELKETRISFDNGGSWSKIAAPTSDRRGAKFNCTYDCSLHLHLYSSGRMEIPLSPAEGIGIVMALGNVGQHLDYSDVSLFGSRDGGVSWHHIEYGKWRIQIARDGAVFVAAKEDQPTNSLVYSTDLGLTLQSFNIYLSQVPTVQIFSIMTNPNHSEGRVLALGTKLSDDNVHGLMIRIEFDQLFKRECSGIDRPTALVSDFEEFDVHTNKNEFCLLGQRSKYVRKRQSVPCILSLAQKFKFM